MRFLTIMFYLVIILLGVSFAALNANSVEINLYITTLTMPVAVIMTMMLGIGICVGVLLSLIRYWRLKIEFAKVKSQLKLCEKEVKNLRDIPLKDQH